MEKQLTEKERVEQNHLFFQCPRCLSKYSELEVQRMRSKDFQFICSHCCPSDNLRNTLSEKAFTLKEIDNKTQLSAVDDMVNKLKNQLRESDHHYGIIDMLNALKDVSLIRNKPSENIKFGLKTSKITDSDTLKEVEENSQTMRGRVQKNPQSQVMSFMGKEVVGGQLNVVLESDMQMTSNEYEHNFSNHNTNNRDNSLPSFLQGSRLYSMSEEKMSHAETNEQGTEKVIESLTRKRGFEEDSINAPPDAKDSEYEDVEWTT
jgi:hypothetical protein